MIEGFFIRSGDKTTCGGVVQYGDGSINLFGFAHARVGDPVTCGVTGGTCQIQGGVHGFDSHGRLRRPSSVQGRDDLGLTGESTSG